VFANVVQAAVDTVPTPDSPISWITSGGVIGLLCFIVLMLSTDRWVTGRRYTELQEELKEVQRFMRDEAIPLLSRVQDVLERTLEERAWTERRRRETQD